MNEEQMSIWWQLHGSNGDEMIMICIYNEIYLQSIDDVYYDVLGLYVMRWRMQKKMMIIYIYIRQVLDPYPFPLPFIIYHFFIYEFFCDALACPD